MGQWLGRLGLPLGVRETSDLNDEQVEEIRMVTSLPEREIHRVRRRYRSIVAQEAMSKDEFFALPGIAVNPLRDPVFRLFELTSDGRVPFIEFARFVAIYSYHSSQDTKLREAFRLHDFDGDGKISRDDLRKYLALTYQGSAEDGETPENAAKRQEETIDNVVSRVLEEASSDATLEFLAYEDFVKVVQPTDFESRLIFPF